MKYTVSENKFFRQYIIVVYFFVLFHSLLHAQQKHSLTFQVDSLIEIGIQKKAFPGAQVLILKKDSTLLHKAYGFHTYDSLLPVLTSDIYDLASVTKVLASTLAFMKLYELYDLDLDEPVSEYIPLIKKSNKSNSTFREVLSHSAGWIPYIAHQNLVRKKNGKFKARTLKHSYSNRFPTQISDSLFVFKDYPKKIMRRISKTKLGAVGEYNYSGLWFFLLPELTQKLSGLSFEDFLAKYFYQPMKLERLGFNPSKKFLKNEIVQTEIDTVFRKELVQGYVHDEAASLMGGVSGNAGLFANATSIAPLLQMLLNKGSYGGREYLTPETIELFTQKAYTMSTNRRGLGFDKPNTSTNDEPYPSKLSSPESYGHSGFTGTFIWVDPAKDCIFIFLSNRVYPSRAQDGIYKLNIRGQVLDFALEN